METLDVPPTYPPPPPPKRLTRPKITLQIPDTVIPVTPRLQTTTSSVYRGPLRFHGKVPGTPASHMSDHYLNPFLPMYHNKASEFLFKQFEGFKDFTMNTAKSGLSAGEKSAFWFYNKLRLLSRKWFTHFFLTLCLVLYSIMGAAIFMTLEAFKEFDPCLGRRAEKIYSIKELLQFAFTHIILCACRILPIILYGAIGIFYLLCEGPNEVIYDKNLTEARRTIANKIHSIIVRNGTLLEDSTLDFLSIIEEDLIEYENEYMECMKHLNNHDAKKKTWSFWNSMFYAGTIYTTIDKRRKICG